ncbi:MAG: prenyltransferase/squalene oxidase repeat-containing protein [Kiritimatiellae bacterium]|nr:prenyltransferase/squalene oxidase repeat-containing protein [Kiritimatiellia bacterium]
MKTILITLLLGIASIARTEAQDLDAALMQEVRVSIRKGLAWLKANQKPDGAWSEASMPAMTALPLWAIAASGEPGYDETIEKAVTFILSKQQPDGGIYVPVPGRQGGGLGNYNTSICISALYATGRADITPAILKGRKYIALSQHIGDDSHAGGFGYDKDAGRRYSDLNNTHFSLEAMRRTQAAEDLRPAGERRVDVSWDAALKYVMQMQNTEGETAGGFAYNTQDPKSGIATNASGRVMLRAYGSMTYAGLLSMVHAKLEKSDPRVRSAVEYAARFWTLDENPGQGQQGLYFYYNVMSRALSAADINTLDRTGSTGDILWREEILRKITAVQQSEGYWINENNRWWENDPVLATSYSLLALAFAAGFTQ